MHFAGTFASILETSVTVATLDVTIKFHPLPLMIIYQEGQNLASATQDNN